MHLGCVGVRDDVCFFPLLLVFFALFCRLILCMLTLILFIRKGRTQLKSSGLLPTLCDTKILTFFSRCFSLADDALLVGARYE